MKLYEGFLSNKKLLGKGKTVEKIKFHGVSFLCSVGN